VNTSMEVQHVDPQSPVVVTAAALRHFRQQIGAAQAAGLRLSVKESGCTGYMYVLDLVQEPQQQDLLMQLAGDVSLYIDRASLPVLTGTTVDMVREGLNHVLRFGNPNAKDHCGCGESFNLVEANA
jgi:iron-sulfur cluster assembly accessory protein